MTTVEIGQALKRSEDFRLLTGKGKYVDDISLDGEARAVILRSPHAHARIVEIDRAEAAALDGVHLIVTGQDWLAEGFGPIPTRSAVNKNKDGSPLSEPPRHCLAIDRVRYVGEAVALIVADSEKIARDALELIDVTYEELPAVTDPRKALADGAPRIWDDIPNNLCVDFELGDEAATKAAFEAADHVISLDVENNRVTGVPIEPRSLVGTYDAETDTYLLYNSTQNVHAIRKTIAEDIFKISADKIHHIAPDVGGGFGAKNSVYPEPALVLYAAKQLQRPVKWIAERSESFLADTHGRNQSSKVQLALDTDGTFRALRTDTVGDIGAYCWTIGPFTPTGGSARTQGGPYAFETMYYSSRAVFTNTMPMDPYRGAGRPEGTYQIERIVEAAASQLGLDPVALRRKNLIPAEKLPMKSPMGLVIDSGNFPEVFERTLTLSDRDGYSGRVAASKAAGRARGFAIAPYLECTGGGPKEFAGIQFAADGTITLSVGSQGTGTGHETAMPQILSAKLGLPVEQIRYRQGDTDATPLGGGHGGSRCLEVGGGAVVRAAEAVIDKAKAIAAHLLNSQADDISFADGQFSDAKTNQSTPMEEVVRASFETGRLPQGMEPGCLDSDAIFERGIISCPNGCHAAEVEVDPETGAVAVTNYWIVDDFGTIINPLLADGQVMGGVAQGIGQALYEDAVYDEDTGQLLAGSLMDYALPRADLIPNMVIRYYEDAPTAKNPLGVKGAGEAGCCPAPPVIVNAILNALKPYGVTDLSMPVTSEKVWQAIHDAKP